MGGELTIVYPLYEKKKAFPASGDNEILSK